MKSLVAALVAAAVATTLAAQPSASPATGEKFVPTALCRLLDTRMTSPANAGEASLRQVDVRTTICSVLLPPFATAYAVRTTSWSLLPPEKTPAAEQPVVTTTRVRASGPLQFAVPASRDVTVDIDGYFVPTGTPIAPTTASSLMKSATASRPPLTPGSNASLTGSTGEVDTDFTTGTTGLLLKSLSTSFPWTTAKTISSDAQSGFAVNNSSGTTLLTVTGDGAVTIPSTSSYFNGRIWYWPPAANGVTILPSPPGGVNVIHDIVIQNPHNANGDTTTRLAFYNAGTLGEDAGSPPITKFQAYTAGTTGQPNNINFDSMVYYHQNQYHYRAFSYVENKDTFWVKAATSGTSVTNTRADMYVSGNVGIGTPTANYKLDAVGNSFFLGTHNTTGDLMLNLGAGSSSNASRINFGYWAGFDTSIWNIGRWPDSSFRISDFGSGSEANRFLIDWQGNVGIGTAPAAKFHVNGNARVDGNLTLAGSLTLSGTGSNAASVTAGGVSSTGTSSVANAAGTIANYYGGGAQNGTPGAQVNGPSNGDGSAYTYAVENQTSGAFFGGKAGGYFAGGNGIQYAGGGVGLMALGGDTLTNTIASGSNAHGGAGLFARGGLNADGSRTWAAWFAGDTMTTGKVGIGTATPDATHALHVVGNVQIDGELTGTNVHAQYQDVAEWVPASEAMTAGTVVILNGSRSNEVMASFRPYDTTVAGVVSARPGVILGIASPSKAQVATTGRVKVKVDATKHSVAIGDLLVTSDKPGMAMVSEPVDLGGIKMHRPGTLIGKALEPLSGGEGEILVLLSLQ